MASLFDDWPYPFWIAHRGAGVSAPENTMAALQMGFQHGFAAFEVDVKLSADGIPFLLHDDTLQRTTDGHGVAGLVRWAELANLDAGKWHSAAFEGATLPTLEEVLLWIRKNGLAINLELKPTPGVELETGRIVAAMVASLWQSTQADAEHAVSATSSPRPLLSSFQTACLVGARDTAPEIPRALLSKTASDEVFIEASALDCAAIVFNHSVITEDLVRRCQQRSLRVLAYTVNDFEDARRLNGYQIDGLITDNLGSVTLAMRAGVH